MWCWRRLLRIPWTARRSNLKEINSEYSLEGLMLRLKLQYFGHLMWRTDSLEKTLMLGMIEGKRRKGQQRMRWLDSIMSLDMSLSKLWDIVKESEPWHASVHGVAKIRHDLATQQRQHSVFCLIHVNSYLNCFSCFSNLSLCFPSNHFPFPQITFLIET